MLLGEWVELVMMTSGTLNRNTAERIERITDHVVAVEIAGNFAVDFRFRNFHMPDEIPRPRSNKTESQYSIRLTREQHIACDLFLNKSGIRLILIE